MGHRVWNRYGASNGPLLARGIAFTALFTLVPALLLIVSIAGLLVGDPETRTRIVASLAAQFPPLAGVLRDALDTALAHAAEVSLIGAAVLVWSASGLVRSLDTAVGILFRDGGHGGTLLRTVGEVLRGRDRRRRAGPDRRDRHAAGAAVRAAGPRTPARDRRPAARRRLRARVPIPAPVAAPLEGCDRPGGLGGAGRVRPDRDVHAPRAAMSSGPRTSTARSRGSSWACSGCRTSRSSSSLERRGWRSARTNGQPCRLPQRDRSGHSLRGTGRS